MSHQPTALPLFVRLAGRPMVTGTPAWPTVDDRRQLAKRALKQALDDVLDRDGATAASVGPTAADAVASALLSAFGNGRWTLRGARGSAEILGKF